MNNDDVYKKGIKRAKKKTKFIRKMQVLLMSLILITSISIAFILVKKYYNNLNSITYENYDLYQYFSGAKVVYKGKATIRHDNKITDVVSEGKKVDAGDIPIYFQYSYNEVLLPTNMELIFPNLKNKNYKINYFSKIMYDINDDVENAFLVKNDKNIFLGQSFLFNGEDLYFFPYSTSVVIDGITYNLSPLSYIIVNYKNMIEIYDKTNDKYTIIDSHNDDVIATLGQYKINLSTDMIMYNDENRLLIKNVDKLSTYNG